MAPRGAGGFEDGEHEVDFEVNFRADLEWIDGRCGIDFGSIWNQCGVHSLTLRVVAVDPDESLPCYVVPCVF